MLTRLERLGMSIEIETVLPIKLSDGDPDSVNIFGQKQEIELNHIQSGFEIRALATERHSKSDFMLVLLRRTFFSGHLSPVFQSSYTLQLQISCDL